MLIIPKLPEDVIEICIMANRDGKWLVITKDGEWIHHHKITITESAELRHAGIEYNYDPGMTVVD